jgi:hypothetical protein
VAKGRSSGRAFSRGAYARTAAEVVAGPIGR